MQRESIGDKIADFLLSLHWKLGRTISSLFCLFSNINTKQDTTENAFQTLEKQKGFSLLVLTLEFEGKQVYMEKLPSDVLSNIFIRLLAKQLAQMRCVSKPCNALLSQPYLIKSHLQRSIHTNEDEVLLVFDGSFSFTKPFTIHPSRSPGLELTNFIKLPVNPQSESSAIGRVIGSVNGLICFSSESCDNNHAMYIWNPSLSAVSTLPPCSLPYSDRYPNESHCGFAFHPKTDDYKIVKLTCILDMIYDDDDIDLVYGYSKVVKEWLQVEVYSMRKGSWELVTAKPPSHRIFELDVVFVDGREGHLHWLGYLDEEWNEQMILAFDLGVETFREMHLPNPICDYNVYERGRNVLGVVAGKLCVMSCAKRGECEVWVMDEYGVAESWVKNQVFSQFSGQIAPFGFTLHNEFLFGANYNRLVLYDPVAAKSKKLQYYG